ncbi:LysR substrate-binding domain-containing protein [Massilia horti]|uniref:LysR substrate-binding domain-containing protein n=1 Tax=Massilia horti TaxID=2562153 RepID=UPI001E49324D|nr:LysR substrate-binding domain-containing protein [Massilia horti]
MRSFIHVARAGSFSRAAAELFIAQPALSRQIGKLEEELGVTLFARHGRGVKLTSAGATLLERAELITHFVRQTSEQVRAAGDSVSGHLSVGLPPAVMLSLGPALVERFRRDFPRVHLHLREGLSVSLQEWVLDRRVDLAVMYNPAPLEALEVQPVFSESMLLVGPPEPGTVGGRGAPVRLHELSGLPLILPGAPHSNRRLVEQVAAENGCRLRVVLEVDSVALTKTLVSRGYGYSLFTYGAMHEEVARGELVVRPVERPAIRSVLTIATLRERQSSQLVAELRKLVHGKLHRIFHGDDWHGEGVWVGDVP